MAGNENGGLAVLLTGTLYFDPNTQLGLGTAHWNPQGMTTKLFLLTPRALGSWESYAAFAFPEAMARRGRFLS